MKSKFCLVGFAAVNGLFCVAVASAQDVQKNVVYVRDGEKLFIENCNMRDLSDASTCMVGRSGDGRGVSRRGELAAGFY